MKKLYEGKFPSYFRYGQVFLQIQYHTTPLTNSLLEIQTLLLTLAIFYIVVVAAACGQREGDAFWYVFADVAPEYGVVDVSDVYAASPRYGEIYRTG